MKQPPKRDSGYVYVVLSELPLLQQEPFFEWIKNQTMICIAAEGEKKYECAYYHDYERWYRQWSKTIQQ